MKQKYKLLAIIIAALLLISALPLAAFADETEPVDQVEENEAVEETTESREETDENDYYKFTLPEGDENTHYEQISRSVVKVTVYPNVTEADNEMITPPLEGYIDFTDPSGEASPMVVPPRNDETILDGGGSITYPSDTYISSSSPTTNYGSATEAYVSNNQYLFISYPMPYIPANANIIEATLNLSYRYQSTTQSAVVYAYKVNMDWDEDTLTWNSAAQHTGMGFEQTSMSYITISNPEGSLPTPWNYLQIDISEAAEAWHFDGDDNHGIALKSNGQTVRFKTSEALETYRPYFEYYYEIVAPIESGTYYIHNVENGQYIDIENGSTIEKAAIETNSFNSGNRQKWVLTRLDDGYYTIKSLHSNKYIGVDLTDGISVKQYSYDTSDYTKWAIIVTSTRNYIFKCKEYEDSDLVLASLIPNSSLEGENLLLCDYTEYVDYCDEWNLGIYVTFEDMTLDLGDTKQPNMQANCPEGYVSSTDFSYNISEGSDVISINNSTGDITPLKPGTATVWVTHRQYFTQYMFRVRVNKNAIIIVPGFMGSQIFADGSITIPSDGFGDLTNTFDDGTRLWDPTYSDGLLIDEKIRALAFTESGTSQYDTKVNLPTINGYDLENGFQYGAQDIYRNLYNELYDNFFDEGYEIILYEYDWREDPYDTALKMSEFIDKEHYGNIVFVSHSMGGLVSSYYLSLGENQRDSVDKHISIGTPYLGSAEVPYIYFTGKCLDDTWNDFFVGDSVKKIAYNIPAAYAMLPFEQNWTPYLSCSLYNVAEVSCLTFESTLTELSNYMPNWNDTIASQAFSNRNRLFLENGMHITTIVDSYYIVGTGESTTCHITGKVIGNTFYEIALEKNLLGDGTVTEYSATIGNTAPSEKVYYKSCSLTKTGDHVGMVTGNIADSEQSDLSTISFIVKIIDETASNITEEELMLLYGISQ